MPRSPGGTPAPSTSPTAHLFDQLLSVSREAHAHGQHEVAYHALIAALHAAQDTAHLAGVRAVVTEARAQIEWIDRNAPGHRLSSESAGRHNHPGVYSMLSRQAETIGHMIKQHAR